MSSWVKSIKKQTGVWIVFLSSFDFFFPLQKKTHHKLNLLEYCMYFFCQCKFPKKSPLTCELLNYPDILSCVYHIIESVFPKLRQQAICLLLQNQRDSNHMIKIFIIFLSTTVLLIIVDPKHISTFLRLLSGLITAALLKYNKI